MRGWPFSQSKRLVFFDASADADAGVGLGVSGSASAGIGGGIGATAGGTAGVGAGGPGTGNVGGLGLGLGGPAVARAPMAQSMVTPAVPQAVAASPHGFFGTLGRALSDTAKGLKFSPEQQAAYPDVFKSMMLSDEYAGYPPDVVASLAAMSLMPDPTPSQIAMVRGLAKKTFSLLMGKIPLIGQLASIYNAASFVSNPFGAFGKGKGLPSTTDIAFGLMEPSPPPTAAQYGQGTAGISVTGPGAGGPGLDINRLSDFTEQVTAAQRTAGATGGPRPTTEAQSAVPSGGRMVLSTSPAGLVQRARAYYATRGRNPKIGYA